MAIQDDGKIVAIGSAVSGLALARYDPNGRLDPSFGGDGRVITSFAAGINAFATAGAIQADGRSWPPEPALRPGPV